MPTFGPALQVNDVIQVTHVCYLTDQVGLNVRHYQVESRSTTGTNMLSLFYDALVALGIGMAYRNLLTNTASYRGFKMRIVQPVLSIELGFTDGQGFGSAGVSPLPRQCAGFIRLRSNTPGHGKSGRVYVPFPDEADCQPNGKPEDNYMNNLEALGDKLRTPIAYGAGGVISPIIYSRPMPLRVPPRAWSFSTIRSQLPVRAFATQRRRGSFGRVNVDPLG